MTSSTVRVRIAPSPTGFFHVGNARTALFNWIYARQHGGRFVVRIEDTDQSRYVPGAIEDMFESLEWLGLTPDESTRHGGDYGPYQQSLRTGLYKEHVAGLVAAGEAYPCFCTPERLAEVRARRTTAGQKHGYDRHCRGLAPDVAQDRLGAGEAHVVRLKMPLAGEIVLHDKIRGAIKFEANQLEDVVLQKSDGFPTYHLAVVVDDRAMAITHVLRADEWIPSGPIQVRLYEAFGWPEPIWVHVPLVLNPSGEGKLSKRRTVDAQGRDAETMVMVKEYRAAGYLPEALFNYLALLGWALSGDEDLFSPDEALAKFRLEDIKTAPAAWNPEKLAWMNGVYIRRLAPEDLVSRLLPYYDAAGVAADPETLARLAPLIAERLTTLAEAPGLTRWAWEDVDPPLADLVPAKLPAEQAADLLTAAATTLGALDEWSAEAIEAACRALADARGVKPREAFQPLRVAATGSRVSPPLFESLEVLGRGRTLTRLAEAASRLAEFAASAAST